MVRKTGKTGRTQNESLAQKKERVRSLKESLDAPKLIGSEDDLIPFSWRFPLAPPEDTKMTKIYRQVVALEKSLAFRDNRDN